MRAAQNSILIRMKDKFMGILLGKSIKVESLCRYIINGFDAHANDEYDKHLLYLLLKLPKLIISQAEINRMSWHF